MGAAEPPRRKRLQRSPQASRAGPGPRALMSTAPSPMGRSPLPRLGLAIPGSSSAPRSRGLEQQSCYCPLGSWAKAGLSPGPLPTSLGVSRVVRSDALGNGVAGAQLGHWGGRVALPKRSRGVTSPCGLFTWLFHGSSGPPKHASRIHQASPRLGSGSPGRRGQSPVFTSHHGPAEVARGRGPPRDPARRPSFGDWRHGLI